MIFSKKVLLSSLAEIGSFYEAFATLEIWQLSLKKLARVPVVKFSFYQHKTITSICLTFQNAGYTYLLENFSHIPLKLGFSLTKFGFSQYPSLF